MALSNNLKWRSLNVEIVSQVCRECKEEKPLDHFQRSPVNKTGRVYICKPCAKEYHRRWYLRNQPEILAKEAKRRGCQSNREYHRQKSKEWYERNKERVNKSSRKSALKRFFGLTPEQYDAMHAAQAGLCAICNEPEPVEGRNLSVDHCHETGRVRGLLCTYCNTGIGRFRDDTDLLRKAAAYLEQHDTSLTGAGT